MVTKKLKSKAVKLRNAGHSYKYIHNELKISMSTLSSWFSGQPYKPNKYTLEKIRNGPIISARKRIDERIARTQIAWGKGAQQLGEMTPRDLLMLGIGLYMGEGSKTNGIVRFSNADPLMVTLFISWMKNHFGLTNKHFALRVHSYPDVDTSKIEKYWLGVTKLPQECLRRTYIDTRSKIQAKSGKLPYGTAHVSVHAVGNSEFGVKLFRLIQGYTMAVTKKFAGIV